MFCSTSLSLLIFLTFSFLYLFFNFVNSLFTAPPTEPPTSKSIYSQRTHRRILNETGIILYILFFFFFFFYSSAAASFISFIGTAKPKRSTSSMIKRKCDFFLFIQLVHALTSPNKRNATNSRKMAAVKRDPGAIKRHLKNVGSHANCAKVRIYKRDLTHSS